MPLISNKSNFILHLIHSPLATLLLLQYMPTHPGTCLQSVPDQSNKQSDVEPSGHLDRYNGSPHDIRLEMKKIEIIMLELYFTIILVTVNYELGNFVSVPVSASIISFIHHDVRKLLRDVRSS